MEISEAKKELRRIRQLDTLIEKSREKYETAFTAATGGAIGYSERVQSSPKSDKLENAVIEMADALSTWSESIIALERERNRIWRKINSIEDRRCAEVLIRRYINLETVDTIAREMNYSYRQVLRIHDRALRTYADK